jgi:hypothetical protein
LCLGPTPAVKKAKAATKALYMDTLERKVQLINPHSSSWFADPEPAEIIFLQDPDEGPEVSQLQILIHAFM